MNNNTEYAIQVRNLTVSYGSKPALLDVSFMIYSGELVGIIGPNGAGKSTLMKAMLGFVKRDIGEVYVFGKPIDQSRGAIAYVPQRGTVDWDYPVTVHDVAMMGRYGQIKWWQNPTKKDAEIVDHALEMVRMSDFRNRQIGQLSGGQQQRVFMARALAQGAKILLLDEPFAGVDAATEHAILDVFAEAKKAGITLVVVHHDLASASEYFDKLLLVKQRLYAAGSPSLVFRPELISEVYEGRIKIFTDLLRG